MTRLLGLVVHDWPLKLAAVGLATLLYGGLVLSESTQTLAVVIPVEERDLPAEAFLLTNLSPVTEVRYFSASGVRAIASSFEAWVDFTDVPVGGGPVIVPIQVRAIDERITVRGFTPDVVTVELDRIATRQVPVQVQFAPAPEGLQVGTTVVEPVTVSVSGPASIVDLVVSARADVVIQPSGISVDQDVPLIPVNAAGNPVSPVNLMPATARVTIPVFADLRSKSLTVSPVITGTPAAGFEIASVTVDPTVVTVAGDAERLAELARVDTSPVSTNGASADFTVEVDLAVPVGVVPVDAARVTVTVKLRAVTGTRSFEVGVALTGARPNLIYTPSTDRILLTLGGSTADLDRLDGSTLVGRIDVTGLGVGTSEVGVEITLPGGVSLVAVSPDPIEVVISAPPPSPTPSASGSASPSPGG